MRNQSKARTQCALRLALLAAWLVSASSAQTMPRSGREADGLVRSVDRNGAMVTVEIRKEARMRSFEWNRTTQFVQHGKFAGPEALKAGAAVRIRYRAPFFGNSFVTKVTLLAATRLETKTTTN